MANNVILTKRKVRHPDKEPDRLYKEPIMLMTGGVIAQLPKTNLRNFRLYLRMLLR
jgi:hypothetical protein